PIVAIGIAIWAPFASPLADGFLAGFAGSGGDVKSGVIGAVTAGMFDYANTFKGTIEGALASGIAGGTSSALHGGKFEQGFLSNGFTRFASPLITGVSKASDISGRVARTLAAAVAGGTTSALGGGKFANGAETAGFLQMFSESSDYYKRTVGWNADVSPGDSHYKDDKGKCCEYPIGDQGHTPGPDTIVVGKNKQLVGSFWRDIGKQGGFIGNALNVVPGINATGHLHDVWWNNWEKEGASFNFIANYGTMLPSSAISYGAVVGNLTQGWQNKPMAWNYISRR
ncbi:MAG: hypothetical protein KAV87_45045, partial [Desulfobacteraceae bacterium]|nr:hypothetical protein [Desulfobacteraceae bacterium]